MEKLSQFCAVWNAVINEEDFHGVLVAVSCDNHTLAFLAAQFGRFQVANHNDLLADEVLRFVPWSDAGNHLASAVETVVQLDLQQLLRFLIGSQALI